MTGPGEPGTISARRGDQSRPGAPVRVYNPDEAARILRCRPSWLKEQARLRRIPFTMIGGAYRWTDAHLAEIVRLGEWGVSAPAPAANRRTTLPAGHVGAPVLRARPPRRPRSQRLSAPPGDGEGGPAPPGPPADITYQCSPCQEERPLPW